MHATLTLVNNKKIINNLWENNLKIARKMQRCRSMEIVRKKEKSLHTWFLKH